MATSLITVLSIAALSTYLLLAPLKPLPPDAPIAINGDANFSDRALAQGWPGDGSPENPYIIDGLQIVYRGLEAGSCILISNTRVSFTISNCILTDGGMVLENVNNGLIVDNFFNNAGISLHRAHSNTVANNTGTSCGGIGINLVGSNSNTVSNNTCYNNWCAIHLDFSRHNTVTNNSCTGNEYTGICLGNSVSNTVVNNTCNDNHREDLTGIGISLWESESNTVVNNTCNSNDIGIILGRCPGSAYRLPEMDCWEDVRGGEVTHSNTVASNTCNNNWIGIYLGSGCESSNIILGNTCSGNTEHDILEESGIEEIPPDFFSCSDSQELHFWVRDGECCQEHENSISKI
jgi:parallel beta-helix repeat protein